MSIQLSFRMPKDPLVYHAQEMFEGELIVHASKDTKVALYVWIQNATLGGVGHDPLRTKFKLYDNALPAGEHAFPFAFSLPSGPLTFQGRLTNVEWTFGAEAEIPFAIDPEIRARFELRPALEPVDGDRYWNEAVRGRRKAWRTSFFEGFFSNRKDPFEELIIGVSPFLRRGTEVPISLTFTPKKRIEISNLRIELIATEIARRRKRTNNGSSYYFKESEITRIGKSLVPDSAFEAHETQEVKTSLVIPSTAPLSFDSRHATLQWELEITWLTRDGDRRHDRLFRVVHP